MFYFKDFFAWLKFIMRLKTNVNGVLKRNPIPYVEEESRLEKKLYFCFAFRSRLESKVRYQANPIRWYYNQFFGRTTIHEVNIGIVQEMMFSYSGACSISHQKILPNLLWQIFGLPTYVLHTISD